MHIINLSAAGIRTDLISEQKKKRKNIKTRKEKDILIKEALDFKNRTTTIYFKDITDSNHYKEVETVFIQELKKYLHLSKKDQFLIVGLGNRKSTPDSLGPTTISHILVTRYLYSLGEVEEGYTSVATFSPDVTGNTGIETLDIVDSIIRKIDVNKIIIIDALKTNHLERLGKTIQITNSGISPGSGIGNTRKEITKKTLKKEIIVIGVPTVIDLSKGKTSSNYMVTPTNIDFLIEKISLLLGKGINISLHKNFIRQNNTE